MYQLRFRLLKHLKMTVWTLVLWKRNIQLVKKWSDIVVEWPFISCFFLKVSRAPARPPFTSEAIKFEPIKIYYCKAPQNDRLNLIFVKDKHTVGRKMARNNRKMGICYCHSFWLRVYLFKKFLSSHFCRPRACLGNLKANRFHLYLFSCFYIS